MGLEVVDETLGKGVVSRVTERGVYVTYEATGEHVMYPRGLPSKLLKSAFSEVKRKRKQNLTRERKEPIRFRRR